MESKTNKIKMLLSSIILCLAICWTGTGRAIEPWNAEVTSNVNLRRSPGTDGRFITVARKGEKVLIMDKHDDWYKVVLQRQEYGFIGWMYGKFLRKVHAQEKSAKLTSVGRLQTTPIIKTLPENPLPLPEESKKTPILQARVSEPQVPLGGNKGKKSELLPNKPQENSLQGYVAVLDEAKKRKAQTANGKKAKKERKLLSKPQENALAKGFTVDKELEKRRPQALLGGNKGKESERLSKPQERASQQSFAVVRKIERAKPATINYAESSTNRLSMKALIRSLLRLLPVVMSCLALLFSYNALRVTKQTQQ